MLRIQNRLLSAPLILFRSLSSSVTKEVWASGITLDTKTNALEVEFNTGEAFRYPAELLRVESPAADAHRSVGLITPKIIHGRRHVGIMDVQPVGRYAVRIQFDDLHSAGIYTYPFLHELGVKKFARMRSYIKALKRAGLSRDPKTMKSRKEEIKV